MTNLIRVYYVDYSDVICNPEMQKMPRKYAQAVGKSILRLVFKDQADEIVYDSFGKPFFPGSANANFSVSYSQNLVILAVSNNGAVGVDVEYIKPRNTNNYHKHFTESEKEMINSDESWVVFYKVWTIKEAVSKAIGKGMGLDFKTINSSCQPIEVDGESWWVECRQISNYMFSIASWAQMGVEVVDVKENIFSPNT